MQNLKLAFGALCIGFLVLMSCNDPSLIGTDVLEEDQFNIQAADDIEILARTVYADPVRTFDTIIAYQLSEYLVGQIDDPIFGSYKSSTFVEFDVNGGLRPEFTGNTLDSAVIILPFDTSSYYGNALYQSFDIEISRLSSTFPSSTNHFSDEEVMTSEVLGVATIFTSPDSVVVNVPNSTDLDTLPPHFRIPLAPFLAQEIFNLDSTSFESNDNFQDVFAGLAFRPVGGANGIFSLNLKAPFLIVPRIQYYYHQNTVFSSYLFPVGNFATKFTTFEHDYTGTMVEEFVAQGQSAGDSLLFIHSMEGTDIELEFPDLTDFQDIVVNKAELIFEVESLPGDDIMLYPPTEQLVINQVDADGEVDFVEDLMSLFQRYNVEQTFGLFGGTLSDEMTYSMNITEHFQRIVDGEASNILRISPFNGGGDFTDLNRGNQASRVVIRGPKNSKGKMKLILNYTKI